MLASVHADAVVSITNVMGKRQLKLCSKKHRQQIAYKRQAKLIHVYNVCKQSLCSYR